MSTWARVSCAVLVLCSLLFLPAIARASDGGTHACTGAARCCPAELLDDSPPRQKEVAVGVVLIGVSDINEKNSTWTGDFYLYEEWAPSPGFWPQTEIYNEVSRVSEQFDRTVLRGDRCLRSRRIRTTLHNAYNLRTFPFDHQSLTLQLSDAEFDVSQVRYAASPKMAGMEEGVGLRLSGWKLESTDVSYARESRPFRWEEGAPAYDYARFSVPVRRHVSFHLSKYFLPLLLIVVVAFSVFWIDPDDLASQVQIGVTCLLAAIALEFTEGDTLPDVNYLTIADRTFSISYVAIGLAIVASVYGNRLARTGNKDRALGIHRRFRIVFPLVLLIALVFAAIRSYTQATA